MVRKKLTGFLLCFANSKGFKGCTLVWSLNPMPLSQRKALDVKSPASLNADDDQAWITLAQTTGEDVRFRGVSVAEATSYTPSAPMWHVISLYRRGAAGCVSYVISVHTHQKSVGVEDTVRVFKAATIDVVMDMLERYTPEQDVRSNMAESEIKRLGPVQAALHSAKMHRDMSQVRRHYDAMVGDFLFRIGSLKLA
jgi:hypothetical protein